MNKTLYNTLVNNIGLAIKQAINENTLNELSLDLVLRASNALSKKYNNFEDYIKTQSPKYQERIKKLSPEQLDFFSKRQKHIINTNANFINAFKNIFSYYGLPLSPEFLNDDIFVPYEQRTPTELEHQLYLAVIDKSNCKLKNKEKISDILLNALIDYRAGNTEKYENSHDEKTLKPLLK